MSADIRERDSGQNVTSENSSRVEKSRMKDSNDQDEAAVYSQDNGGTIDVNSFSQINLTSRRNMSRENDAVVRENSMVGTRSLVASSSGSATGNPRNKTALAPGHSVMDWIRLGNSGVDLTGVGGVLRNVTLSELANHNKQTDAWIAIRGVVFNVTRYMNFHPGGIDELMKGVGKDATKLFENVHAWVNYQSLLQKCIVGRLDSVSSNLVEKSVTKINNRSSTFGLIKSCTKQITNQESIIDSNFPNVIMDWRQTSNTITLFYRNINDYSGVYYQLEKINEVKFIFKLSFEKDVLIHELEFSAEVSWPPTWSRNYDTMQVDFTFQKIIKAIWKSKGSFTLSREPIKSERSYKDYKVVTSTSLCKFVNLLVLRTKDSLDVIPAGRYLEAKININEMEITRPYTPVPPCLHPEDTVLNYRHDCICLIVKRYPDGVLSPMITTLQPDQTVMLSNALGTFTIEWFNHYSVIYMLAAGTGLTAMLGIIQRSLAKCSVKSINLINFNKNQDHMFYVAQLDKACTANSKLKVTHILSQPDDSWKGKRGKVSDELLKQLVGNSSPEACILTCGPQGFMKLTKKCLWNLNWKDKQMYDFND